MRNDLLLATLALVGSQPVLAQTTPVPRYMQLFYEGAGWTAGRPLLHYSPALRGKTDETVAEPDSTKSVSPGAFTYGKPPKEMVEAVDKDGYQTTYVRGQDGKLLLQPSVDERQKQAQQTRLLNLLDARAALARNALTTALNAAAADGWEVAQVASWGSQDGLVYLLRRR